MKPIFYYDGKLFEPGEPAIPMDDRALFFGDAVYDACLVTNGIPYLLSEHLDRFYGGCDALFIRPPMPRDTLDPLLRKLCEAADAEASFLYFQASRSAPTRRHAAKGTDGSHLLITLTETTAPNKSSRAALRLAKDTRYEYCNINTTNLLPAVLASTKAAKLGADETVFVRNGYVTECAHSNVSILKNGILFTHPTDRHILPGIARAQLLFTCERLGIPALELPFSARTLIEADEIFITSTTRICQRANSLSGKAIGLKDEVRARAIQDMLFDDLDNRHYIQ